MKIQLWDGFIRGFHWLLVATIAALWFTGGKIDYIYLHELFGIVLLALVLTRIIWGFVGSESSRFCFFIANPKQIFHYMRDNSSFQKPTHNPMGAWSTILMLLLLCIQGVTGLFTDDSIFYQGPLASWVSSDMQDTLTSIHHYNFTLLKAVIGLHIVAIIIYRIVGDSLVMSMFTGKKEKPSYTYQPKIVHGGWGYLLLAFNITWLYSCLAS